MTRPLRYSQPWQPVEVTARTIQGRFLLLPSKMLNSLIAGVLALGRKKYDVHVYNLVFLSNHFHLLMAGSSPHEISAFMGFVMSNIAREAGRLHNWRGPFWERRHRVIPIADDESLVGRMRYIFENGCKEGLAKHPALWSGLNAVEALTRGRAIEGMWVDRSGLTRASKCKNSKPKEEDFITRFELKLDVLPIWRSVKAEQRRRIAAEMAEDAAKAAPASAGRATALIADGGLARRDPHHRPEGVKNGYAPLCHAASKAAREAFREAYRAFVTIYRAAAEKLRERLPRLGFPKHAQVLAFSVSGTTMAPYAAASG